MAANCGSDNANYVTHNYVSRHSVSRFLAKHTYNAPNLTVDAFEVRK